MPHSRPGPTRAGPARLLLCLAVAVLALGFPVSAQTLVNGDMDGVADFTMFNSVAPPGWTTTPGGTDLWDATTTAGPTTWQSSAGGGPFVHGVGKVAGFEAIAQQVTGLTVGATYVITFEQSISHIPHPMLGEAGFWRVGFGTSTLDAAVMTTPAAGVAAPWVTQSLSFTANATTQELSFKAFTLTQPPKWRSDLALDTVQIQGACPSGVPGLEFVRLGTPPNPFALLPSWTGPPVIGALWDPVIDHTSFVPNATVDAYLFSVMPANIPSPPAGTILCSPAFHMEFRTPQDSLHVFIPNDCLFFDIRLCVWGASLAPNGSVFLTNALDVAIGTP